MTDATFYCTQCGQQLDIFSQSTKTVYDRNTGAPIIMLTTVYRCPLFQEGYADRYWHTHDQFITEEKVKE